MDFFTAMVTSRLQKDGSLKANLRMASLMGMLHPWTTTETFNTPATGKIICHTGKVVNNSRIVVTFRVIIMRDRNVDMERIILRMVSFIKGSGKTIKCMATVK